MDLFKYKAAVAEINATTKIRDLEVLVREYSDKLYSTPIGSDWYRKSNLSSEEQIRVYKVSKLSYMQHQKLSKSHLPRFVAERLDTAQKRILKSCLTNKLDDGYTNLLELSSLPTYVEFMDMVEFDTTLWLPPSSYYIETLNSIIGNEPIHFEITFNYEPDYFDSYSTNLPMSQQKLVYAVRYKQVNFPKSKQTIWDLFLEKCKSDCRNSITTDQVTKLKQHIKAIKATQGLLADLPAEK